MVKKVNKKLDTKKLKEVANLVVVIFLGGCLILMYIEYDKLLQKYNEKILGEMTAVENEAPEVSDDFFSAEDAQEVVIDYKKENEELKKELEQVRETANEYVGRWLIAKVIQFEGTESNHPADPGGYTRFGISSKIHGFVPKTYEEAVEFYLKEFWYGMQLNKLNSVRLQFSLMDAAVLFGDAYIRNLLINLLNVESYEAAIEQLSVYTGDDGKVDEFINLLKEKLHNRIKELTNANKKLNTFAKGWANRVQQY